MANGLTYLLESPDAFTGYFIVGEEQERIGVVKALLAKTSPVFQQMLYDSEIKETGDVKMPDIHPDALKLYLKFAYGALEVPSMKEEMTGWNPETCLHVVHFTEKYIVPELQQIALAQLKPTGVDDLFPALHCLTFYGTITLADDVQKIVKNCTYELLQHNDFKDISEQSLVYILKQDALSVPEVVLFKATVAWITHHAEADDVEKQQLLMKQLLQHIRLLTIPLEDVYNVVEPSKMLSKSELIDLSKAIMNKTSDVGFCSNNMHNRTQSLITVSLSHSEGCNDSFYNSEYIVKTKGKTLSVEAIICHASYKSSATTVLLTVSSQGSFYELHSGQISYNSNEDIIISPKALGWSPIRLEPDCEYYLDLVFEQALPGRRQEYRCPGHTFHYGSITCAENYDGSIYSHIKELKLGPIII